MFVDEEFLLRAGVPELVGAPGEVTAGLEFEDGL